jgi:glycosyltransferase involved in cell wall biosynthesis
MHTAAPELTVLMPCLNEARTLRECIEAAQSFFRTAGVHGEVLIADNGSTDGSPQIASSAGARVVNVERKGYGAAILGGMQAARGRFVIMGDADRSYDFASLGDYLAKLRTGVHLVMGNRFAGGIEPGAMPFLHKYLGNPVLSFIGRLFFRTEIGDFHCGLRGFSRDAITRLGLVTPGMEFASEMVAKASLAGLRIEEVPTVLRRDGRDRKPHLRTWRDGWRHLRFLLLFCPRWLFLYPGLALFLVGAAGLFAGLPGVSPSMPFTMGMHSLLYMAASTILGFQLVVFALLTKWLALLAGMVPEPNWMSRWAPILRMEVGLVTGLVTFLGGLGWSLWFTAGWSAGGFGALDPVHTMPLVIPAVTLMAVGSQAAMGALFAGALLSSWRSRRDQ